VTAGPGATTTSKDNKGTLPDITEAVEFSITTMSNKITLLPAVHAKAVELTVMFTVDVIGTYAGPPFGHTLLVSSTNVSSVSSLLPVKVDRRTKILTRMNVEDLKTTTFPPLSTKVIVSTGKAPPDDRETLDGNGADKLTLATSPDEFTL
jgi:hypothetical protein